MRLVVVALLLVLTVSAELSRGSNAENPAIARVLGSIVHKIASNLFSTHSSHEAALEPQVLIVQNGVEDQATGSDDTIKHEVGTVTDANEGTNVAGSQGTEVDQNATKKDDTATKADESASTNKSESDTKAQPKKATAATPKHVLVNIQEFRKERQRKLAARGEADEVAKRHLDDDDLKKYEEAFAKAHKQALDKATNAAGQVAKIDSILAEDRKRTLSRLETLMSGLAFVGTGSIGGLFLMSLVGLNTTGPDGKAAVPEKFVWSLQALFLTWLMISVTLIAEQYLQPPQTLATRHAGSIGIQKVEALKQLAAQQKKTFDEAVATARRVLQEESYMKGQANRDDTDVEPNKPENASELDSDKTTKATEAVDNKTTKVVEGVDDNKTKKAVEVPNTENNGAEQH